MFNKKKLFIALALLVALSASAFAADQTMTVKWTWLLDDSDVIAYRYQLDGEADDAWTVVDGTTDSYSVSGLDPYLAYVLYLQCSYDGENWSPSASSVAEPLLTNDQEATSTATPEPVNSLTVEPAVEAKKKSSYGYQFNLDITTGVATNVAFDPVGLSGAFPRVGLGFEFQNIVHAGPWGMGLRLDANVIMEPELQDWSLAPTSSFVDAINTANWWWDSSYSAQLVNYFGNRACDFYLGAGGGFSLYNPHFITDQYQSEFGHSYKNIGIFSTAWFATGTAGLRFRLAEHFKLGAEVNLRYLIPANKFTGSADLTWNIVW